MSEEEISQIRNLQFSHNINLHRMWWRKHHWYPLPRNQWWAIPGSGEEDCVSTYITPYSRISPIQSTYFELPNTQECRVFITGVSINAVSSNDAIGHYFNIADSWIDVQLSKRNWISNPLIPEGGYWGPWIIDHSWRAYGQSGGTVDIWDASEYVQSRYTTWPPQSVDKVVEYRTAFCDHETNNTPNTINYHNINNINHVYEANWDSSLDETAMIPFKDHWSGFQYVDDDLNETVFDVVGPNLNKFRIEKRSNYHRIWAGFGDGDPGLTGGLADAIKGNWDSRAYTFVFDLKADRTLEEVDYGTNISWPTFDNDDVLYDSTLRTNKGVQFNATSPFDVMGAEGSDEIFRIIDEERDSFISRGFDRDYILWESVEALVKKPPVIE